MLDETATLLAPVCGAPSILLTRYMDNTYVVFCNIPQQVLYMARAFLVSVLKVLYQAPFKWEHEGRSLSWGECCVLCVSCMPTCLSLSLKRFMPE